MTNHRRSTIHLLCSDWSISHLTDQLNQSRIQRQSKETLSRQILEAQQANQWPGLSSEVKEICLELGIADTNENYISDGDIKKAVLDHHDRQLVLEVSRSKKMMEHSQNNFREVEGYTKEKSLENCRMAFCI